MRTLLLSCCLSLLSMSCQASGPETSPEPEPSREPSPATTSPTAASAPEPDSRAHLIEAEAIEEESPVEPERAAWGQEEWDRHYPWLSELDERPELQRLSDRFAPPGGFRRVEVEPGSYQEFLRDLPLRMDRDDVRLYNGERVSMPSAGIVALDVGSRDLQQCADSIIRLRAEYLWREDREKEASFHYTSGDRADWKDWRAGSKLRVKGSRVEKVRGKAAPDTREAYRSYLRSVFMYASTRSMHRDASKIESMRELRAGDFFLAGGSPGHVVLLLDIAEHADGRRVALVGQGYLPARDFHVIRGSEPAALEGAWFVLPSDEGEPSALSTPTWKPFPATSAWRFRGG